MHWQVKGKAGQARKGTSEDDREQGRSRAERNDGSHEPRRVTEGVVRQPATRALLLSRMQTDVLSRLEEDGESEADVHCAGVLLLLLLLLLL